MSYHRERHNVLAGNVTNLETPGFRPADLERGVEAQVGAATGGTTAVSTGGLAVTHEGHIAGSGGVGGVGGTSSGNTVVWDDGGDLQGPDGNAVTLEREMAKIDANRVRYNTSAELVTRRLAMLRYAAGDGVG